MNPEAKIRELEDRIATLELAMRQHNHYDARSDRVRDIVGARIRTSTSPSRVEMSGEDNALYIYYNDEIALRLNGNSITFLAPGALGSGSILGLGTNQLAVDVGGGSGDYEFNENSFDPLTDVSYALGASNRRFTKAYMQTLALVDGISAPSTLAGHAQIYVDTADGDLKVKFGDGTTKVISADT